MPSEKLRKKGISSDKFDSCARQVSGQKGVGSAHAICEASFQRSVGLRPKKSRNPRSSR